MKHLQLYGYSDDSAYITIIDEDGALTHESDDCFARTAYAEIKNDNEGIIVAFNYTGTWIIGIGQLDEGIPIPEWAEHPQIQIMDDGSYTVCLEFYNVPDNITIKWRKFEDFHWVDENDPE